MTGIINLDHTLYYVTLISVWILKNDFYIYEV